MVLAVGARVKDFTIDKFLGKGSYGAVYKCTRAGDGLPYAMKQINTRNMSHKERQDAVNEIRILASVVNPYVIRFCEAFVEDDMLYIITEYANHGDLFKRLQRLKQRHQSLPEDACWIYFIQLLLGVQALHRNSILHRDLKSANVFLASHNRLKIGDLGVAKLLRAQEAYAKTQIGTPYYVSPELWKNKPYNSKSDVWALGCLLYEMVELKPPFDSTNMRGLARKVLRGAYPQISSRYSTEIGQMIKTLLIVNPSERPTCDDILKLDSIVSRMHMLPPEDIPLSAQTEDKSQLDLVGTIHVPRKMRDLTKQLPSPRYESDMSSRASNASTIGQVPPWNGKPVKQDVEKLPQIGEQSSGGGGGGGGGSSNSSALPQLPGAASPGKETVQTGAAAQSARRAARQESSAAPSAGSVAGSSASGYAPSAAGGSEAGYDHYGGYGAGSAARQGPSSQAGSSQAGSSRSNSHAAAMERHYRDRLLFHGNNRQAPPLGAAAAAAAALTTPKVSRSRGMARGMAVEHTTEVAPVRAPIAGRWRMCWGSSHPASRAATGTTTGVAPRLLAAPTAAREDKVAHNTAAPRLVADQIAGATPRRRRCALPPRRWLAWARVVTTTWLVGTQEVVLTSMARIERSRVAGAL